jgi:hypothetical protein
VHVTAAVGVPEQVEERDQADHERADRHRHAEQVPPPVGAAAAEDQHQSAEHRERQHQPGVVLEADRGHGGHGRGGRVHASSR